MGIEVLRKFFKSKSDVLNDINQTGYWPTTIVAKPSPSVPLHWHDVDVHGYVFEGQAKFLDGESNTYISVNTGDKFIVNAGVLHAECETEGDVIMILALPKTGGLDKLLIQHPPN